MEIRPFEPRDETQVIALWERCGLTRPWNDPRKDIRRKLAVRPDRFLVGIEGGEVIASLMIGYDGHRGWVYYFGVAPQHRRKGHGRAMMAEAERLQGPAGLRHRKIEFLQGGDELIPAFQAAGWSADRLVVMVLDPEADRRGDAPASVREVAFDAVRELAGQWYREGMSAAEARDLVEADADTATARPTRFFLAERDGEPAAYCMLLGDAGIGEVESVYTSLAHRGGGLASAVVRAAIAASQERGDDLITIAADAADWPQHLYERLGFRTVDRRRAFTRKPPA